MVTLAQVIAITPRSLSKLTYQRSQAGVSLIEVMVTMVIMSVGLLGVAGLQLKALKNTYASFQRSLATLQAQDLTDRLWANTCIFGDENKLTSLTATPPSVKKEWRDFHLASSTTKLSMPNWDGDFTYDSATGLFSITIRWTDLLVNPSQATAGETQTLTQYVRIPTVTCN